MSTSSTTTTPPTRDVDPLARAAGAIGRLAVHCGHWGARDRYRPGANSLHPRAEVNRAVETIDAMTAALAELRNTLIAEARAYDDEHNAATDELLARLRSERGVGPMIRRLVHLDDAVVHDNIERSDWERMLSDDYIRWVMEGGDVVLVWSPEIGPNGKPNDVELHTPAESTDENIVEAIRRAALAVGLLDRPSDPAGGIVPAWANYSSKWQRDTADGSCAREHRWSDGRAAVSVLEVIEADGTRRVQDVELDPGQGNDMLERHGDLSAYAGSLRAAADVLDRIGGELR